MKVKVIAEEDYRILEEKANKFMLDVNVIQVSVHEQYERESDRGYVAYHIFYTDKTLVKTNKRRTTPMR